MTIDIEKLINEIDEDGSGQIEYDEFMSLLSSSDWTSPRTTRDFPRQPNRVKKGTLHQVFRSPSIPSALSD